jgi:hypothetical protein
MNQHHKGKSDSFFVDLLAGGLAGKLYIKNILSCVRVLSSDIIMYFHIAFITGAIDKTATAPIERVKLLIQTQDSNPLIRYLFVMT